MNPENVAAVSGVAGAARVRGNPSRVLKLELRLYGDVALLRLRGRLVYRRDEGELISIINDLVGLTHRLVVDLSGMDRIDSAGLGELVTLHMWADGMGYHIAFAAPNARVQNLLALTNLTSLLDVHSSVEESARALAARAARAMKVRA